MCILCNDDTAYRAYMDALYAMEQEGGEPDMDRALDAAVDAMKATAGAKASSRQSGADYLSAFICDPIEK